MRWLVLVLLAGCAGKPAKARYVAVPSDWEVATDMAWERLDAMAPILGVEDVGYRPWVVVVPIDCLATHPKCVTASSHRAARVVMVADDGRRPSQSELTRHLCRVAAWDDDLCTAIWPALARELADAGL